MFLGKKPIHIAADADIASLVLMPGDPLRAKYIAENFLENAKMVTSVRNMYGFTGFFKGIKVTVMGSGMGMPSMGIYAFELFHYFNVEKIIRIGTCGAVDPKCEINEMILCSSAYTESNFAYSYNDYKKHVVAASDELNEKVIEASEELNLKERLDVGMLMTTDVFGPYIDIDRVLDRIPKEYQILGEEMEAFALLYIAKIMNKSATAITTVVDSKFSKRVLSVEEREKSLNNMINIALNAIIK